MRMRAYAFDARYFAHFFDFGHGRLWRRMGKANSNLFQFQVIVTVVIVSGVASLLVANAAQKVVFQKFAQVYPYLHAEYEYAINFKTIR